MTKKKKKLYEGKPLQALLITGGCCHDYPKQKDIMAEALTEDGLDMAMFTKADESWEEETGTLDLSVRKMLLQWSHCKT